MLSSETKVVTYVNKKGERSTYPLNSAMESANLEMVKRLKYTKDILTHMLNANAAQFRPKDVKDEMPGADGKLEGAVAKESSQTVRPSTNAQVQGAALNPRTQATERNQARPYSSSNAGGPTKEPSPNF